MLCTVVDPLSLYLYEENFMANQSLKHVVEFEMVFQESGHHVCVILMFKCFNEGLGVDSSQKSHGINSICLIFP